MRSEGAKPDDELWAAVRRALPDPEELATAVAAEVGEPVEDVRLSVLIGTIAMNGRLGPEATAINAIEAEIGRPAAESGVRLGGRLTTAETLSDLLAEARELEAKGTLDLETIVAIHRASGVIAARSDRRMVELLHRYSVTRRFIWEHSVTAMQAGDLDPVLLAALGRFLLLWQELTSLAVTDGYRAAERDILARDAEARRAALDELLGVVGDGGRVTAMRRRTAVRHGLDPDRTYSLVAVAPRAKADPIPERPGIGEEELDVLAGRIGHLLGATAPGAEGLGTGIRLPAVLPLLGCIAILGNGDWAGLARVPKTLDEVLGPLAARAVAPRRTGTRALYAEVSPAWVAVCAAQVPGIGALAGVYADLVDATRTAQRLGRRGWIPDPDALALERLLLADRRLADATLRRELGPVLADERFGAELVETLEAYFDAGGNVTAAARRLNLATRTVAYRLQKIEALTGSGLDGERGRRLSAALLVHRLRSDE